MSNLIEYSRSLRKARGSLLNYYRNETAYPITDSESFKYRTIITGSTPGNDVKKSVSTTISLKNFSSFWRTLNIPSINCEVNLILVW